MAKLHHALICLLLSAVLACGRRDEPGTPAPAGDAAPALDTPVMAFLSMARARHHEANVDEAQGDVGGAIAALTALTASPKPHPDVTIPEVEEVLADTYARIAELELSRGGDEQADKAVEEGLRHAEGPTYFRGHLLEVSGILLEARAAKLADAGKPDEADALRKKAKAKLHEAIDIQEKVVSQSTTEGDK